MAGWSVGAGGYPCPARVVGKGVGCGCMEWRGQVLDRRKTWPASKWTFSLHVRNNMQLGHERWGLIE